MTDPGPKQDDWQQFAEDVAACAYNVVCTVAPEKETRDAVKRTVLEAQAKLLKGLLTIIEGKLNDMAPSRPHRSEKISIE